MLSVRHAPLDATRLTGQAVSNGAAFLPREIHVMASKAYFTGVTFHNP